MVVYGFSGILLVMGMVDNGPSIIVLVWVMVADSSDVIALV